MVNIPLRKRTIQRIENIAKKFHPNECCGFVIKSGKNQIVYPTENIHEDKTEHFKINPLELNAAEKIGTILCIYHSHNSETALKLSLDDLWCSDVSRIPFFLVSKYENKFYHDYYDPNKINPYLGRQWEWGRNDCYSLIKDWYEKELNIVLSPFRRYELELMDRGWDRFQENFREQGFRDIIQGVPNKNESIKRNDIIMMAIRSNNINHIGVYIDEVNNLFLHHLQDRLSECHYYDGWWREATRRIVAHKNNVN